MRRWAVLGDPCVDGTDIIDGELLATNPQLIRINNLPIIVLSDHALPDIYCPKPKHCDPIAATGSATVFAYGLPVHRDGDLRITGFPTLVTNQFTVFVGG